MKRTFGLLIMAAALLPAVEHRETIQKAFPAARKVTVDNVFGSIRVTGYDGSQVEMTANMRARADSEDKLQQARREVSLDITQPAGELRIYVDGPFRCSDGCYHEHGRRGYQVQYDFELRVPRNTDLNLRTVNGGEVAAAGTWGRFDARNVNGGIDIQDVEGGGSAHTVNGAVKVGFRSNPREDSEFKTVNGSIDVWLRPGLSADLAFKTFNGDAYTDFEAVAIPLSHPGRREGGKFVYRSNREAAIRVGSGGPNLRFDTLNGDIRVRNKDR